ncbi:inositol monophosphatase [Aaosphaeria arxii CBS 175.79]|uniref:Inositol-1-monophosphatase n=1 Tax=Aaosphaeria arxii CBS 175.79 TaxID=1450172 RepID=A0A6A5XT84_9PLEO|nr:inositol monophosphatase [Aaosphaeria arxii CBS 175.79]KAF2016129.1 inositol monophosphatase [Aaosphaeria arxii CBS 175.79]
MADINLQEIHDFMISIARRAGEMITSAHPTTLAAGSKKNSADLVTETDQAVEKLVSTSLREKYPDFAFMGEETYKPGDALTAAPTFICDPIDGTNNFVHRYPYVSISLGLAIDRVPTVGVVYNPFTDVLYTGIKGQGSFVHQAGQKHQLPLSPPTKMEDLSSCLVAVEWGSDRSGNDFAVKSKTFSNLAATKEQGGGMVHGLRSFGSAALNLCGVATGGLDVYWEAGCWAWDVCAGWVILKEAGGVIADANPGNWEPKVDGRRYLAVRGGEGQNDIVKELWGLVEGAFEVGL